MSARSGRCRSLPAPVARLRGLVLWRAMRPRARGLALGCRPLRGLVSLANEIQRLAAIPRARGLALGYMLSPACAGLCRWLTRSKGLRDSQRSRTRPGLHASRRAMFSSAGRMLWLATCLSAMPHLLPNRFQRRRINTGVCQLL